ncbi:MAG TPA: HAMP domain-containing sensor histidine kinase [Trichormus sp.]|jgi:signal transduction histidine kinase
MLDRLTLGQKGLLLLGIPLIVEIIVVSYLVKLQIDTQNEVARESRARTMLSVCGQFAQHVFESGRRAQQLDITSSSLVMSEFNKYLGKIADDVSELAEVAKGHPQEAEIIAHIDQRLHDARNLVEQGSYDVAHGAPTLKVFYTLRMKIQGMIDEAAQDIFKLAANAKEVEASSPKIQAQYRDASMAVLLSQLGVSALIAIALCIHFNRTTVRRLGVVMDNTVRLSKGQPLHPPLQGTDEIARLDGVFNEMAAALKEAEQRRAAVEKLKQEFLSMVTHDLRTPLTSVRAALTILGTGAHGQLNQNGQETLDDAEANVVRLINLINDLLDIDKLESGKFELDIDEVALTSVVQRSISAVEGYAKQQQVNIVSAVDDTGLIYADGDRLVQVLVNLLSNAIKFSRASQTVTLRAHPISEQEYQFAVIDEGRGVAPEVKDKIFRRFEQATIEDSKELGGSGLGLAICKAIVEEHHGTIGVDSEFGKGSTFWFRIPTGRKASTATATS